MFRMYEEIRDFESAVDRLYELYGRYHWVHTINNAALVTAALLYSRVTTNGDHMRGSRRLGYRLQGATVGSILGVIHGADRLPEKWIAPLRSTIRTSLRGFDRTTFPELYEDSYACTALLLGQEVRIMFDKAYGALAGLAIGDSFGDAARMPENHQRFGITTDFTEESSWSTDDTEFALLTAQSHH